MDEPVLSLLGIYKNFGTVEAAKDINIDVSRELFALLGPSGSGKTTMLRIIAGLETPDKGQVIINGRDVTNLPPYKRGIGMVFQDFLLFPHKTVKENIIFPLKMQNLGEETRESQYQWISQLVHLEGLGERFPYQLSGGQKQRVSLARGLVSKPSVLLLDEPLANLDRELRKEMEIEIRRFQLELGIPFIYVTHNQEEALTMSDRMAIMRLGVLEQIGDKFELYHQPRTPFVASFLGTTNAMQGAVTAIEDGQALIRWNGQLLKAQSKETLRVGTKVDYFIKSEKISIHPQNAPANTESRTVLKGVMRDAIFKGQYADYLVDLSEGVEIIVSAPPDNTSIQRNMDVFLSWSLEAPDVFPTQGA